MPSGCRTVTKFLKYADQICNQSVQKRTPHEEPSCCILRYNVHQRHFTVTRGMKFLKAYIRLHGFRICSEVPSLSFYTACSFFKHLTGRRSGATWRSFSTSVKQLDKTNFPPHLVRLIDKQVRSFDRQAGAAIKFDSVITANAIRMSSAFFTATRLAMPLGPTYVHVIDKNNKEKTTEMRRTHSSSPWKPFVRPRVSSHVRWRVPNCLECALS
jgi:hypothetical protein